MWFQTQAFPIRKVFHSSNIPRKHEKTTPRAVCAGHLCCGSAPGLGLCGSRGMTCFHILLSLIRFKPASVAWNIVIVRDIIYHMIMLTTLVTFSSNRNLSFPWAPSFFSDVTQEASQLDSGYVINACRNSSLQ